MTMTFVIALLLTLPFQSPLPGPKALDLHTAFGSPDAERFRLADDLSMTAIYAGEETCKLTLQPWTPKISPTAVKKVLPAEAVETFLDRFAPIEARGKLIRGIDFRGSLGTEIYEHVRISTNHLPDMSVTLISIDFLSPACEKLFNKDDEPSQGK